MSVTTQLLTGLALGLVVAACGAPDRGGQGTETDEPLTCEHGSFSACTCTDGAMGMQMCAHDSSGFEPCQCEGGGPTGTTDAMSGTADGDSTAPTGSTSDGADGATEGTRGEVATGSETGPIGAVPTAQISHPGDGEDRAVDVPIPFIGTAMDVEDGPLSGASMVWVSDVDGPLGEGETFDAALMTLGTHVVTLLATDSDGNVGEDSVTLEIVP